MRPDLWISKPRTVETDKWQETVAVLQCVSVFLAHQRRGLLQCTFGGNMLEHTPSQEAGLATPAARLRLRKKRRRSSRWDGLVVLLVVGWRHS